jgi:hypothetical protein
VGSRLWVPGFVLLAGLAQAGDDAAPAAPAREAPSAIGRAQIAGELARRFAPQLRFNAFHPDGSDSLSNRNEDFLPGSVDAFFRALATGGFRVVGRMSEGARPAEVQTVTEPAQARFEDGRITGFPERLAGAAPGVAPTYVHVYRADDRSTPRAGGGVRETWFCEYWQWYPYDFGCSRFLGRFGCIGGHRGDWEHQSVEVEVQRGPAGALEAARIVRGHYFGHGWSIAVPAEQLERVDDVGEDAPDGTHPVVYVAVGKHASYPHAGELHDYAVHRVISDHDDFFRGNGVRIDLWRTALIDISKDARDAEPGRFAPPALQEVLARSPGVKLETWLDFRGRWGPDYETVLRIPVAASPTGPYAKSSFGDAAAQSIPYERWRRRFGDKLRLYKEAGRAIPRADPPPVPLER